MKHLRPAAWATAALYLLSTSWAYAATDNATLTVGTRAVVGGCGPLLASQVSGYEVGTAGSYSPTGLTGGRTVIRLFDLLCNNTIIARLDVSGFSSNPGQTWLTSVTCNGVTKLASASTYIYSGGTGEWLWNGGFGFLFLPNGTTVNCSITHN